MKNVEIVLILSLSFSTSIFACTDAGTGFLPKNNLSIPPAIDNQKGISRNVYDSVISKVESVYAPIVARRGAKLKIMRLWDSGIVNAGTYPNSKKEWIINMYGGLARHALTTPDSFAGVICHELGHHLGGYPRKPNARWASNEGQSDYFASTKCLRRVFRKDNNRAIVKGMMVPDYLKERCDEFHESVSERSLCIRIAMAGLNKSLVSATIRNEPEPRFETPMQMPVKQTFHAHPKPQCRLDTFFQGALCDVSMNEDFDPSDEVEGACHELRGHTEGMRPGCWFNRQAY